MNKQEAEGAQAFLRSGQQQQTQLSTVRQNVAA